MYLPFVPTFGLDDYDDDDDDDNNNDDLCGFRLKFLSNFRFKFSPRLSLFFSQFNSQFQLYSFSVVFVFCLGFGFKFPASSLQSLDPFQALRVSIIIPQLHLHLFLFNVSLYSVQCTFCVVCALCLCVAVVSGYCGKKLAWLDSTWLSLLVLGLPSGWLIIYKEILMKCIHVQKKNKRRQKKEKKKKKEECNKTK